MRILVIDDDRNICDSLKWILEREGNTVHTGCSGEEALSALQEDAYEAAFLDVMMPGMGGMDALERMISIQPQLKIFMISGQADISVAVRATKLGAYDFLEKPLNPEKVVLELRKLVEQSRIAAEVDKLKELVDLDYRMVGESAPMQEVHRTIQRAAPSEGRILIFGENGTGKELVAHEIHQNSHRRQHPFVQLNCAAIPKELIESELFGYEKGAFTGAYRRKPGLFEQAEGGTLLLDEVGDMALETQAKLLRVLQESEFFRVGGMTPQKFNVRIVSATNKDLLAEIQKGSFREDLYFRLNVIPIRIPPLREHPEDIPALVQHFMERYCQKNGKKPKKLTKRAESRLMSHHWPGNVRELKNIMERLAIMTAGDEISAMDVESVLGPAPAPTESKHSSLPLDIQMPLKRQLMHFEKAILEKAFKEFHGNVSHIAAALQTDRANLHRKLKKFGIKI